MIKMPKKVRECFQTIRNGNAQKGLAQLDAVEGFEYQKDIAKAEIAYFSHDWRKGLDLARSFLPHDDAWHFSNIFDEHIELALVATWKLGCWEESQKLFADLLKFYRSELKGAKKDSPFTIQLQRKLDQIKDRKRTIQEFTHPEFQIRTTGNPEPEIDLTEAGSRTPTM